jgi:hypothetical protein
MSPPTNAEINPAHNSDDVVMEGEYIEDEDDHAPKNNRVVSRDVYLRDDVVMLLHVLKVTVAVCEPNILAKWEGLKMISVPIMPNWNACYSIYDGEGGAYLHVTNKRVDVLKLGIMLSHENIHDDLNA